MGRNRRIQRTFRKGQTLTLEVTDMAFGGKGIARLETDKGPFVVFVQNAMPGQTVEAQVVKCKSKHAECRLLKVLKQADYELDLPYQPIPGAPYLTAPLELQHQWKEETALTLYRKIAQIDDVDDLYQGLVPSPLSFHYRNKMEYSFSEIRHDLETDEKVDDFGLGFKHRGTWWAVENLDQDSGLFDEEVEANLHKVRAWCEATGFPAWHPPQRKGFFRFFVVRKSAANGGLLFNLVTTSDHPLDREGFVHLLVDLFGDRVEGVLHTINDDVGERVEAREGTSQVIHGNEVIHETLHGLTFGISMGSFFQTNPLSAERLYAEVMSLALEGIDERPSQVVMDLFCGTGTIGQLVAKHTTAPVVGVDLIESAIEDASAPLPKTAFKTWSFSPPMPGSSFSNTPSIREKFTRSSSTRHAPALHPKRSAKSSVSARSASCTSAATPPPKQGTCWNSLDMATNSNRSSLSINFRTRPTWKRWHGLRKSRDFNRTCRHEPSE